MDYKFYGQSHFTKEYRKVLDKLKYGENFNIFLSGPSGYGKTHLAIITILTLGAEHGKIYIPNKDGEIDFYPKVKIHFIDEAHLLQSPEVLYPKMDSGKYTFIFATNKSGMLPEALKNRCLEFTFVEYDRDELIDMARDIFPDFNNECLDILVDSSTGVPRNLIQLCRRIKVVGENNKFSPIELKNLIEGYFQIRNGLSPIERLYLETLEKVGVASLNLIINLTKIDRVLLTETIEPHLIRLDMIEITSKGRMIKK